MDSRPSWDRKRRSPIYRLDDLTNPYAPTDAVADVLGDLDQYAWADSEHALLLRRRLGQQYGVDHRWVLLAGGVVELYRTLVRWREPYGPLVTFPPTGHPELGVVLSQPENVVSKHRQPNFSLGITPSMGALDSCSATIAMSPNDPTGTLVRVQELVRLTRQCELIVIDERHGGYSPRSAAPFTREFDNLVVFQSMEWWAGLRRWPLAWAIAPPSIIADLEAHLLSTGPSREAMLAALATLDDWSWMRETLRRVTFERGRLYRQLRKLSMITPLYPSWANFLLARFERGDTAFFLPRLAERGIHVHPITDPKLPNHVRVSAVSAEATDALKRALIEIALEL
ncbi:MAG: aminotransferase class I/II-fold pyridoxal phosphate-dependent enzyme [Chloroflexota bacterium]|nr:aminotransferase class I/II-fold pyridoxal phosphate-dependent enzyme [Chloroflexota bacterium]